METNITTFLFLKTSISWCAPVLDYLIRVGERVVGVSIMIALVTSVIVLAVISGGADPQIINEVPLFVAIRPFYSFIKTSRINIPTEISTADVLTISFNVLLNLFVIGVHFLITSLNAFLLLAVSLIRLLPSELLYLASPLFFILVFFQLTAWVYYASKLVDFIRSFLPFK